MTYKSTLKPIGAAFTNKTVDTDKGLVNEVTIEPASEFDARFRPTTNLVRSRWERVALAHRTGKTLPPVSLVRRPEGHYVVDGRHRVSVARALKLGDIEAWVRA